MAKKLEFQRTVRIVEFQPDNLSESWADLFQAAADWLRENEGLSSGLAQLDGVELSHGDVEAWDGRGLILAIE